MAGESSCGCCTFTPFFFINLSAQIKTASGVIQWCGFPQFEVEGQPYDWDVKYREETREQYWRNSLDSTSSHSTGGCHETQLDETKYTYLRAYEPEDDAECIMTDYGEVACESSVNASSSGSSGSINWSGSLTGNNCTQEFIEACTEDGITSESYCGCNTGVWPVISHTVREPPAISDPKTEKYSSVSCFTTVSGGQGGSTTVNYTVEQDQWVLTKLTVPNQKPTESELKDKLSGEMEDVEWEDDLWPYIYYNYSAQKNSHFTPSVFGRALKLHVRHNPTPTCYLKVWLKGVTNTRPGVNPGLPFAETSAYDETYEWEVEGECWDSISEPDKIIIKEFEYPYPAAPGAVWMRLYKYSFIKDYEPDNPVFRPTPGDYVRPVNDVKPNGTPFGHSWATEGTWPS